MTDAAGRITFYNEAAAALWGCKPELGKSEWCGSWKLYWPDGTPLPHDECPMAVTLKTGRPVRGVEAVAERPDGTRVPFMPYPTPLRDASGSARSAPSTCWSTSPRPSAPSTPGSGCRAIVESSDDAIVGKDLNGIVSSWNGAAERLFGYRAEEVIGKSVTILIPPDSHNEEPAILERIRRGERIDHYETVRRRKDGSLVDISLTVSPDQGRIGPDRRRLEDRARHLRSQGRRRRTRSCSRASCITAPRTCSRWCRPSSPAASRARARSQEAQTAVLERLHSLGQAHILLVERQWQGIDLSELARGEMRPFSDCVSMSGPPLVMSPQAAQTFALALHELATNAAKYGALSSPQWAGRHRLVGGHAQTGAGEFTFHWQERNGPAVTPPARKGFGRTVLEHVMAEYAGTPPQIEFASSGLTYRVGGPLEAIAAAPLEAAAVAAR